MKAVALALALHGVSALLPARPPRAASALSAAKVPGANQRVKNTYDLKTIERTLATERDACGVGFVAESAAGPSRRVIIAATAASTRTSIAAAARATASPEMGQEL